MQKEIQLTDKTLLVVGLPKEATDIEIIYEDSVLRLYWKASFMGFKKIHAFREIYKGYELLGIYPELTEEQCAMVTPNIGCKGGESYFNYLLKEYALDTAKESFQSLMERENITGYDKYAILIKSK